MQSKKKGKILVPLGVLFLILTAMLIRYADRTYDSAPEWLRLVRSGIYIGMIAVWGVSLHRRILQNQTRRYLTAIAGMMVLWLTLRTVKYSMHNIDAERYLWYCYYLPMLLIPTFSIAAAMSLGKPENYRLPRWLNLLYIPTLALLLALTFTVSAFAWQDHGSTYTAIDALDSQRFATQGENSLPALSQQFSLGLHVDIVDDLEGESINNYAALFYNNYGYGVGPNQDGALLIALIVCLIFKAQMKTAKKAAGAENYLVDGSFQLTNARDDYVHTTRTSHKIERNNSGGSSRDSDGFGGSSGGKF